MKIDENCSMKYELTFIINTQQFKKNYTQIRVHFGRFSLTKKNNLEVESDFENLALDTPWHRTAYSTMSVILLDFVIKFMSWAMAFFVHTTFFSSLRRGD